MFVCIIYIMFLISLQKKTDFINTILFSVVVFEGVSFVYLTRLVCLIWKDEVKHSRVVFGVKHMSSVMR